MSCVATTVPGTAVLDLARSSMYSIYTAVVYTAVDLASRSIYGTS